MHIPHLLFCFILLGHEPGAIFSKLVSFSGTTHIKHHSIALFLYFQNMYDSKLKAVACASKNLSELNRLEVGGKSRII